jgi:transketolase
VQQIADLQGVRYLRTMRPATPVIYGPDERFEIGGSRVLRASDGDQVTLVGSGITVHEAIAAADTLAGEGVAARVLDCYSVKPIDAKTLRSAARATGRIVVAEDHWPEGGLGDAVLGVFADGEESPRIRRLAVAEMPGSGKPPELLAAAGIDASGIADGARALLATPDDRG